MRKLALTLSLLLQWSVIADDWSPPENPDPMAIMQEIKKDTAKGNYEVALAKQLWYHENAVKLKPSLSGVRLSFALSNWLELGEAYPPALDKMREMRDATEEKIRDEKKVRVRFQDFHDFVALNKTLREEKRTVEVFKWLHETEPEDAERVYGVSSAALIKQKEFELCGQYLETEKDVARIGQSYSRGVKSAKRFGEHHQRFVEKKVVNDAATLVAILAKNGRDDEAKESAAKLKGFVTDGKLSKRLERALESALTGKVPKPWP